MDYQALHEHGKLYSGLTPHHEALLRSQAERITPHLSAITDDFYRYLGTIPATEPFLKGRIDHLKATHHRWLAMVVAGPYDADFAAAMHKVGVVHVNIKLPVEFMTCGITAIQHHFNAHLRPLYSDGHELAEVLQALNAVLGYCLIIMQESYQSSLLAEELERFLAISGISRQLFNNMAKAYH